MFKIRCLTQSKSGYDSLFQSIIRHTSVPTAIHMLIVSILLFRPDCFVLHKNNKFHSDLDYKFEVRTSVNTGTIVYRYLSPNEFHLTEYRCRRETSYLFFFAQIFHAVKSPAALWIPLSQNNASEFSKNQFCFFLFYLFCVKWNTRVSLVKRRR